jgi:hypothetical protein
MRGLSRFLLPVLVAFLLVAPAWGAPPSPPMNVEGTGTSVAFTDGPLAGFTFSCSEPVSVMMTGGSNVVSILVQPINPPLGTVAVTLRGLPPGSTWYLYGADAEQLVLTADAAGAAGFPLDLSNDRALRLQSGHSTYVLRNDATGGDCTRIGEWYPNPPQYPWSHTPYGGRCVLNQDVSETIQFAAPNIILDGAGHTVTNPYCGISADFYANWNRGWGLSVRNLVVDGAGGGTGFVFLWIEYTILDNVTIRNTGLGIQSWMNRNLTVRNSSIENVGTGLDTRLNPGPTLSGMDIGPVSGAAIFFHIVQGSLTNSVIHDCGLGFYASNNNFSAYNNIFRDCAQLVSGDGQTLLNVGQSPGPNIIGGPFIGGNFYTNTDGTGYSDTANDYAPHDGFADQPYVAYVSPSGYWDKVDNLPLVVYRAYVNAPPVLAPIGDQTVAEGQTLTFTLSATDANPGETLTFGAANLPPGASFDAATATFTWTPGYDQAGFYPGVEFTVTDNGVPIALDVELIAITVGNTNRPPVFDQLGPQAVNEYDTVSFRVSATDPDGDAVTIVPGTLPRGASFDASNGLFTWRPDGTQAGVYPVYFDAVDNGVPPLTSELGVVVTVGRVSSPIELIQEIIAEILSRNLADPVVNSYLANLKKVEIFILESKLTPAINEVQAFIHKCEQDIEHGAVPRADGEYLLMMANDLLALLKG